VLRNAVNKSPHVPVSASSVFVMNPSVSPLKVEFILTDPKIKIHPLQTHTQTDTHTHTRTHTHRCMFECFCVSCILRVHVCVSE